MSVLDDAPRGAIKETVGGREYVFCMTLGAIEKWEDRHPCGIYQFLANIGDGKITSTQARDVLAVALVGGGMPEDEAKRVMDGWGPDTVFLYPPIASRILTASLFPQDGDEIALSGDDGDARAGKA